MKEEIFLDYVTRGDLAEIERLIGEGVNIHYENENGDNALIIAAKRGYMDVVRVLLEAGSHIYSTNKYGHNPLIVAAMQCHPEVVKVILEFSKKVSERKTPSVVAIMAANSLESQGCTDVAEMLRTNPG